MRAAGTSTVTSSTGPSIAPPKGGPLFEAPFSVQADRLEASPRAGRYVAKGHVEVRRPGAALFADEVVFDQERKLAYAKGHVVAVDGPNVLTCDAVTMRIPELYGGLENAELRIKDARSIESLLPLKPDAARAAGKDELIVRAERLERTSKDEIEVEGGSFTACDCGEGNRPSWRIWSKDASIDLDRGAWLTFPVFYVLDVPVLALPVMYVPLGPRRTGLLTPRFGYVSNTGFRFGQPLYLALGRSWDVTLEPFYLTARGGGLDMELRYAPTRSTKGVWRPSVVLDFGHYDNEGQDWDKTSELHLRWALAVEHDTRWSKARLRADFNVLGDPAYQSDFASAFLTRQAEFNRSRVTYGHRMQEDLRFGAGLQLMQDLRTDSYLGSADNPHPFDEDERPNRFDRDNDPRSFTLFSDQRSGDAPRVDANGDVVPGETAGFTGAGSIRYRFADLSLEAAPFPLWEAIGLVGQARLAVSAFSAPRPEIARFVRADLRPAVSAAIDLPFGLVLEPSLIGRLTAWAGRGDRENVDGTRLAALARTRLTLDLMRDFGPVVHRIRPALEHLILPGFLGEQVAPAAFDTQDEIDALARVHQVRARLETALLDPRTGSRIVGLDTWMGRDLRFRGDGGNTSELVSQADLHVGRAWPVRLDFAGALALRLVDPVEAPDAVFTEADLERPEGFAVTEARVQARVSDRRGDSLSVGWGRFGAVRPEYMLTGLEELVPSGAVPAGQYTQTYTGWRALPGVPSAGLVRQGYRPWSPFTGLTVAARAKPIDALTLGFDMTVAFEDEEIRAQLERSGSSTSAVRNTRTTVGYVSPCDCWSAFVAVSTARDREGVQIDFGLDLARLGSVGAP